VRLKDRYLRERNNLIELCRNQELQLIEIKKTYLSQGDLMHKELSGQDAEKQQLYQQIVDLTSELKITKTELAENEIYLEGYGGKTPFVLISAKAGTGVEDLLSLINLIAEMENFTGNKNLSASGYVLEAHLDSKRGIEATLVIKNGTP